MPRIHKQPPFVIYFIFTTPTFVFSLHPQSINIKHPKQRQLQNTPSQKTEIKIKMHGADYTKCGASSDGTSKTCASCGAVRFLFSFPLLLFTQSSFPYHLSKYFALD